jgi:hypothetical protein
VKRTTSSHSGTGITQSLLRNRARRLWILAMMLALSRVRMWLVAEGTVEGLIIDDVCHKCRHGLVISAWTNLRTSTARFSRPRLADL